MKVVITLGSDAARPSLVVPMLKLAFIGAVAFLIMNRDDIRRYMRIRNM